MITLQSPTDNIIGSDYISEYSPREFPFALTVNVTSNAPILRVDRVRDLHAIEVSEATGHKGWVIPGISEVTWYDSIRQLASFVVKSLME